MGKNNHASMGLRPATINDIDLLTYWDKQPHIIESNPNDNWDWETTLQEHPAWRELFIAEADGIPVGFIQILDPAREETHYWGIVPDNYRAIDIWIGERKNIGKGFGTWMMELAIEHCFRNPDVVSILIDPLETNKKAHRFYERLGFKFIGKRIFGSDHCFVYRLDRQDWYA
jgi:aminoglycoside 6'-N-acetyltransferase